MRFLIAFALLVAAAVADPQFIYSGLHSGLHSGLYGGALPVTGSLWDGRQVLSTRTMYPSLTPYIGSTITYPSQDTSRGLPQPVQDTPEVKHAKAVFAEQYKNAAVSSSIGSPFVHTIHKRAVLPVTYKTPVVSAATPYHMVSGNYYGVSPYNYGVGSTYGVPSTYGVSSTYGVPSSYYHGGVSPVTYY